MDRLKEKEFEENHEYLSGTTILRVSNELPPGKAKNYEAAFKAILQ